jgi:hypothetical protein
MGLEQIFPAVYKRARERSFCYLLRGYLGILQKHPVSQQEYPAVFFYNDNR